MSDKLLDSFNFFLPLGLAKSSSTEKDGKEDDKRWIEGIASTDSVDMQDEKVMQKGLDFTYFLKHGFFNHDHKEQKVGQPTEARITKAGLWVKGYLFKNNEKADYWWELINSLDKSGSDRKVGFSIEGKVTRREGKSIIKAWIKDIAVTASPINTDTYIDIAKSLCAERWCVHPWKSLEKACKGCPGSGTCMNKSDIETEEKALTSATAGNIIPESLEGGLKDTNYFKSLDELSFRQTVEYLQLIKGYDLEDSFTIASKLFKLKGIDE